MRLGAIERKILAGFLLALVISLIIGLVLYQNATRIISTEQWVGHTDEVLDQLDQLLDSLVDLDAGQRGYLLTTNETFLGRVQAAEQRIPVQLDKLRQLTADNPIRQQQIPLLQSALNRRLESVNQVMYLLRTNVVDAARARMLV